MAYSIENILLIGLIIILIYNFNKIINHQKTMGKIKKSIFEANNIIIFTALIINAILLLNHYFELNLIKTLIFSVMISLGALMRIRYFNNIREKGLVLNFNKIYWEDIESIKNRTHCIKVKYLKNDKKKETIVEILKYKNDYLEEVLKEKSIPME